MPHACGVLVYPEKYTKRAGLYLKKNYAAHKTRQDAAFFNHYKEFAMQTSGTEVPVRVWVYAGSIVRVGARSGNQWVSIIVKRNPKALFRWNVRCFMPFLSSGNENYTDWPTPKSYGSRRWWLRNPVYRPAAATEVTAWQRSPTICWASLSSARTVWRYWSFSNCCRFKASHIHSRECSKLLSLHKSKHISPCGTFSRLLIDGVWQKNAPNTSARLADVVSVLVSLSVAWKLK